MKDLLEELVQKTGCAYLSDLHTPQMRDQLCTSVETIPATDYSAQEWYQALVYITQKPVCRGLTSEDLRDLLAGRLHG